MYGQYPERVLSAVCASSGLYADDRIWQEDVNRGYEDNGGESETRRESEITDPGAFLEAWVGLMLKHTGTGKNRIERPLRDMVERWSLWQPQYERKRPLVGPSLLRMLKQAPQGLPLLVVIGGRDSEGSRNSSRRLLEWMPEAREAHMPEAGHFSNMEQPELFNLIVADFLAEIRP